MGDEILNEFYEIKKTLSSAETDLLKAIKFKKKDPGIRARKAFRNVRDRLEELSRMTRKLNN